MKSSVILGIDPGLSDTGYGLIRIDGKGIALLEYGCIRTKSQDAFAMRLGDIAQRFEEIVKKFNPSLVSIEGLFFYKNISSALKVGQAKGAIIAIATRMGIPVDEYTPLEIKLAITGYGKADKNQMQQMIKIILKLSSIPKPSHAADALAAAICCAHNNKKTYA